MKTRMTALPADVTRKARRGSVSVRKAGNRLLAAHTAPVPTASPTRPPPMPPLSVAL